MDSHSGYVTSIGYNGTYFLAGCAQDYTSTTNLAYSSDGIHWSAVSCSAFSISQVRGIRISSILWNGSNWLIGTKWDTHSLYISSGFSSPFSTIVLNSVTCTVDQRIQYMAINPDGIIVAAGMASDTYNNIAYSLNKGVTWNAITTTPTHTTMFSTIGKNVIWNGVSWIASGSGSWPAYGAAISSDGINWQGIGSIDARIGQADQTALASSGYVIVPAPAPPPLVTAPTIVSVSQSLAQILFTNTDATVTNHQYSTDGTTWTSFSPAQISSPLNLALLPNGSYTAIRATKEAGVSNTVTIGGGGLHVQHGPAPTLSASGTSITATTDWYVSLYQWSKNESTWTSFGSSSPSTVVPTGLIEGSATTIYVRYISYNTPSLTASISITYAPTVLASGPVSGTISPGTLGPQVTSISAASGTILAPSALSNNTTIQLVDLSNATNISTIPAGTFKGCTALTNITLPVTVTTIDASAFSGCSALATITIPGTVTIIGARALDGSALASITLSGKVTIGEYAFSGCVAMVTAAF